MCVGVYQEMCVCVVNMCGVYQGLACVAIECCVYLFTNDLDPINTYTAT